MRTSKDVTQVLFNAFIVTPELSSWHADATIALTIGVRLKP